MSDAPRPDQPSNDRDRLLELLAGDAFVSLSVEEQAELESLTQELGDVGIDRAQLDGAIGRLVLLADAADQSEGMPDAVKQRIARRADMMTAIPQSAGPAAGLWLALAAMVALLIGGGFWATQSLRANNQEIGRIQQLAEEQRSENSRLVEVSRLQVDELRDRLASADAATRERGQQLALAAEQNLALVERLEGATRRLTEAEFRIARYEKPEDPETLARNRRELLDLGDTVRVAWQPFNAEGMTEAEQPGVSGDVVWNDAIQQGYLRFDGLKVNDPAVEQYQVWVIDERGLEQKVSGGVFNASAAGEVIVPIEPGIDVGRVALFAITIEKPGGTWVPDLERRVVVAPRGDG